MLAIQEQAERLGPESSASKRARLVAQLDQALRQVRRMKNEALAWGLESEELDARLEHLVQARLSLADRNCEAVRRHLVQAMNA